MSEITQKIWDALPEERQAELLDQHRYHEVQFDVWHEDVQESFTEKMKAIGIEVMQIYFSGFSSQGDGACFGGSVADWPLFLAAAGQEALSKVRLGGAYLSWRHSGHYYHEHCTAFETGGLYLVNPFDKDVEPLRHVTWNASYGEDGPLIALEEELIEFIRSKMRELYSELEEEYDYLTGDENVLAYILDHGELEEEEDLDEETMPSVC